ncbi:MAG TPA: head GIN domain-containing protein [Prolixibacteraceae bacterium]|nr:head GIN domain-containing protein [Prolixibacteraceae bacterium]
MKTKLATVFILFAFILSGIEAQADEQSRKVDPFTEISLRVGAKLYLTQGEKQNLEIVAKPSAMEEIITEVKNGKLIIRFPNKDFFWKTFQPGDITIYITTPEINGLGVVGSGDIIAEDEIKTKIVDLAVSGSGSINLSELSAERVKSVLSGSGNIILAGKTVAQDLSVNLSGSGNFKGLNYSADDVTIKVSGSGNVDVEANNNLYVRLAGSGNVTYKGKPSIDQSIAGSGSVRSAK